MSTPAPHPLLAAFASAIFPGLGQILNGDRPKGLALACTTAGIWGGISVAVWGPAAFRSWMTVAVLGAVYPFAWFPAVIDAYQAASGSAKPLLSGHARWYVIFMLVTVGPMSLPLLWQNPRFSRQAKIIWTAAVAFFFILGVVLVVWLLPGLERALKTFGLLG